MQTLSERCGRLAASSLPVKIKSPANATHAPRWRYEVRLADVMARFLLPRHGAQPVGEVGVSLAVAQERAEVVFGHAKEAGADFAVGGEADAVAVAAKWLAHRRDDADFAATIREGPAFGSGGRIVRRD